MVMAASYVDALRTYGSGLVTHIGLVDAGGTEITGGGYARQPVTWNNTTSGVARPTADLVFNVASGAVVAGWRAFTALTAGTNHGGGTLTQVTFGNAGTYTLTAASTSINHTAT